MKEKILVIAASNNKYGNSVTAAQWFLEDVDTNIYDIEWVYLYDLHIDPFTNENRKAEVEQSESNKDIRELIDKIEAVDKVIIATPIWNFSVPSVLKSMIDRSLCSGRVWSTEKKKKIPGWGGKKFYLIFTMGGPWYALLFTRYAIGQMFWVLWYYGAQRKIVKVIFNCGNGSKCVITERNKLRSCLNKKGKKYFT